LALLRPIDISPPKPWRSATRRNQNIQMPKKRSIGATQERSAERKPLCTSPENFTPWRSSSPARSCETMVVTNVRLPFSAVFQVPSMAEPETILSALRSLRNWL